MTKTTFNKFIRALQKEYQVFGPTQKSPKEISVQKISNPKELTFSNLIPLYSYKSFFLPSREVLFKYSRGEFKASKMKYPKVALVGMGVLDLKALVLYDWVFEKDPYYQACRKDILVIGQASLPKDFKSYQKDVLEKLNFDIFLGKVGNSFKVLVGTQRGIQILKLINYKNSKKVRLSQKKQKGLSDRDLKIKDKIQNHFNPKIWEDLGKRCIECGKCAIVCPTCFCFDIKDQALEKEKQGQRERAWTTCFYNDFSKIAGGEFLDSTAKKIHFWYYHKFVRIPDQYNLPGCVHCGRCTKVCPAGIKLEEELSKILGAN